MASQVAPWVSLLPPSPSGRWKHSVQPKARPVSQSQTCIYFPASRPWAADSRNKSGLLSGQVLSPVCRWLLCGRPVNSSSESCVIHGNTLPSQFAARRPLLHFLPPWACARKGCRRRHLKEEGLQSPPAPRSSRCPSPPEINTFCQWGWSVFWD